MTYVVFSLILFVCIIDSVLTAFNYPRESEGLCFYQRWFVCLSVYLFVTTITK